MMGRQARYRVIYPTTTTGWADTTVKASSPHDAIRRARLSGFDTPADRTVDLNAEPEVQKIRRAGAVHVYGPRYGGW
ncbi:hypothetical protein [Streptomyces sp. DW26H14]|uniref:hypothetical protein n=1 Tax=Streptomyces sp. DW26H14 TaxID=3435395 RepID=UPI00403E28F7